jgi:hypothetical protein
MMLFHSLWGILMNLFPVIEMGIWVPQLKISSSGSKMHLGTSVIEMGIWDFSGPGKQCVLF